MITSGELAQSFAAQQAMFQSQNQFAQSIGFMHPGASLAAYGSPAAPRVAPPMPGMPASQPFTYAPVGPFAASAGGGNRFSGGMMSGMGAVGAVGAAMMFDPFSAFLGGAARFGHLNSLGGLAAGAGGGLMAAAPHMMAAYAAHRTIGAVVQGGQQQAMMNTALGQNYNFFNPASRTGAGFSRDDAKGIGDMVRQLAHIPELMTSVSELTSLMPKLKQMGAMNGVKDATEFSRRFKEAVGTIRDMSRVLGSTMDEAAEFFAHSRGVGFIGSTNQLKNTLNAQFASGMTGMTMGQTMQMQQSGASLAMGFGGRRASGAAAVTNIAQKIGFGLQEGFIRDGLIGDVTGMDGPDGIQAAAGRAAQLIMNMGQSAPGRLLMAGMMTRDANGLVTLDQDFVKKLNAGQVGRGELAARASRLSNDDKITFTARAGELAPEMAAQVDVGSFVQQLVGHKGRDAANLQLQRYTGGSSLDADLLLSLGGGEGMGGLMESMKKRQMHETAIREQRDPSAMWRRLKTKVHSGLFGGLEEFGASMQTSLARAWDDFVDDLVGRHVVSLSKEGAAAFQRAMSGGGSRELKEMFAAAAKSKGAAGRSVGSWLGGKVFGNPMTEYDFAKGMLGATGDTLKALGGAINRGTFRTDEGGAALGDVQAVLGGIRGWDELDNAARGRAFNSTLADIVKKGIGRNDALAGSSGPKFGGLLEGDFGDALGAFEKQYGSLDAALGKLSGGGENAQRAARLIRAAASAHKKGFRTGGFAAAVGASVGGGGTGMDWGGFGSIGGVEQFFDIESADKAMKAATRTLHDTLGSETASYLATSAVGRQVLGEIAAGDESKTRLLTGPSYVAAQTLGVSEAEVLSMRRAMQVMKNRGSAGAAAVTGFSNTVRGTDIGVIGRAVRGLGARMGASGLAGLSGIAKSFTDFGTGNGDSDITNLKGGMGQLAQMLMGASDSERERILAATGELGAGMESIRGTNLREGNYTLSGLMKKFGLSGSEAQNALQVATGLGTKGGHLGADALRRAKTVAMELRGTGHMMSMHRTDQAGSEAESMRSILTRLDQTIDRNSTIIAANALGGKTALEKVVHLADDGTVKFGPKGAWTAPMVP